MDSKDTLDSHKKLFYFTSSFPYGLGETWKSNELKYLRKYFDEIVVVPYTFDGNFSNPKKVPEGVYVKEPLFREYSHTQITIGTIFSLLNFNLPYYLREFFGKRVFLSKGKLAAWLLSSISIQKLIKHNTIQEIIRSRNKNTSLYFFWGKGGCDFLPFASISEFGQVMVRFHRYDLFEDQNNGYIPYRKYLLNNTKLAAPSSCVGYDHLKKLYPKMQCKLCVVRLGVEKEGEVMPSTDGVFRILSCSYVVPVKRVNLIAECLKYVPFEVEWIHVGDGPLMEGLNGIAGSLPSNIKVIFPGMINTNDLIPYYKSLRGVDLFLNVSSSEGVPMSIMECLSLSIPVFATDVGGTREIIDDQVGKLLDPDVTPRQLADFIYQFGILTTEKKAKYRERALQRFSEKCNAQILANQLADILLEYV